MNVKFIAVAVLSFLNCTVISTKLYAAGGNDQGASPVGGDRRLSLTLKTRPGKLVVTPPLSPENRPIVTKRLPTPQREEASYSTEAFVQALIGDKKSNNGSNEVDAQSEELSIGPAASSSLGELSRRGSFHRRGSASMPVLLLQSFEPAPLETVS